MQLGKSRAVLAALIVFGSGWLALRDCDRSARIRHTAYGVERLAVAARRYLRDHPAPPCPTIHQLASRMFPTYDAWRQTIRVTCGRTDITSTSSGPDQTFGTADNIVHT